MLENIAIPDSNNKGVKLCLVGEKLVGMCSMISSKRAEAWTPENMSVGYFPVLQLPGYVMKGVTMINFQVYADGDFDADMAMLDAFVEEQGVFSEAVVQILENYKDGFCFDVVVIGYLESLFSYAAVAGTPFTDNIHFHRLPDDVVVNIFDKVSDVQSLCRCLVVSKRFSSLVPLVQTLSFKISAWDYLSFFRDESEDALVNGSLGELSKLSIMVLLLKTLIYLFKPSLSPCLRLNSSSLVFLDKLTRVRSLNLEFVSDFDAHNDSVFKWGAKFASNLKSVTFLYASSFSKMMKSEEEEEEENVITHEELLCRVNLAINCLKEAVLRFGILFPIIAKNPKLQSITITDSNNKGVKLCLGGEKLVQWMSSYLEKAIMRVGYVPVLRLPMSGYVMKRVTVVHFNLYGDDDSDAEEAMLGAFVEEQGVFFEAVVQILENHKDSVKAMFGDMTAKLDKHQQGHPKVTRTQKRWELKGVEQQWNAVRRRREVDGEEPPIHVLPLAADPCATSYYDVVEGDGRQGPPVMGPED
ncbi:hypothetical protein RHSIM_Rhsim13G0215200 [Rhododendron simsii]|uniref:F-box domain-containing protein n=1 Tax=Rhododendron simsii TaxID=118357 RepID=A0A834L5P1_RHOSS|nr:hypothetical protein RHSIM_Rhsim13G0215200 [Rhododendron simsii]